MNLDLYKEIVAGLSTDVTLRHDVDVSIEAAVEIAIIDHNLGKKSMFFFRYNSPYYSINPVLASWVRSQGHYFGAHIGLVGQIQSIHYLNAELKKLDDNFRYITKGFTIHLNNDFTKTLTEHDYNGWRNYNLCPDGYVSDARGIMPQIPTKGVLNLHPEWWVYPGQTPQEKLEYYFNQQYKKCLKEILPD